MTNVVWIAVVNRRVRIVAYKAQWRGSVQGSVFSGCRLGHSRYSGCRQLLCNDHGTPLGGCDGAPDGSVESSGNGLCDCSYLTYRNCL
ncbi:hypothetical protein [Endozoicomonas euniceicola]|uniref:Uncharacterized protein n=1 Tax=Endozoicomonas euniceicola TaxID=1234143 RepID=A0ABY6H124_9GAMM|nr:hypothetical protein [Endozoicomonas euniceicola]UYM18615.1 hypothetical protein NX720_12175 [Endozoicomonas euniceicola]